MHAAIKYLNIISYTTAVVSATCQACKADCCIVRDTVPVLMIQAMPSSQHRTPHTGSQAHGRGRRLVEEPELPSDEDDDEDEDHMHAGPACDTMPTQRPQSPAAGELDAAECNIRLKTVKQEARGKGKAGHCRPRKQLCLPSDSEND